jgi:hypothetical protein
MFPIGSEGTAPGGDLELQYPPGVRVEDRVDLIPPLIPPGQASAASAPRV